MFLSYGSCAVGPILHAVLCEQFRRSIWNILKNTFQLPRSGLIYVLNWNTEGGRDNGNELHSREYEMRTFKRF
ncbi:hypothetical protein NPIL_680111 [Nephila pilipes]|uniref:Uncharacterized protein n=1 Tax=Nephila pilipes TaxID=299642 RepID=A0A8X6NBD0_NEPPI|nr:hypothetical protein NPIL_680111 [Nephila pilipes]